MSSKVSVSGKGSEREARNRRIVGLRTSGWPVAQIADEVGTTKGNVYRVLAKASRDSGRLLSMRAVNGLVAAGIVASSSDCLGLNRDELAERLKSYVRVNGRRWIWRTRQVGRVTVREYERVFGVDLRLRGGEA